jgi:hypothetical protein
MKLKKRTRKLAKKAGFIFWSEEDTWGPGAKHIDWSCTYDQELEQLVELVATECANLTLQEPELHAGWYAYQEAIRKHFKIKE